MSNQNPQQDSDDDLEILDINVDDEGMLSIFDPLELEAHQHHDQEVTVDKQEVTQEVAFDPGKIKSPPARNNSRNLSYPGGKPSAFSSIMENMPGSPTSSIVSSTFSSKHSASGEPGTKKAKTTKKKPSSTTKRRTKPCSNKVSMTADPGSSSNLGQVGPEEYVVEKIVGKRMVDNVPFYFIKWKGWAAVHNTWEPVENLDGCPGLLEKYEKTEVEKKGKRSRGRKKENGSTPSECGSSFSVKEEDDELITRETEADTIYKPTDEMKKTREELVEYGVLTSWPSERTALEVVGVVTIDRRLTYIVRFQTSEVDHPDAPSPPLSADNVILIRASCFRDLYPHLIIRFYEGRLVWRNQIPDEERERKVAKLMIGTGTSTEENKGVIMTCDKNGNKTSKSQSQKVDHKGEDEKVENHIDDEKMEVDENDEDLDPPQQIFIRKGSDLFGLPENLDSSDGSSSDEEFVDYVAK